MSDNDDVKRFAALLRKKDADQLAAQEAEQARIDAERSRAEAARALAAAKQAKSAAAGRLKELRRSKYTSEALARAEGDYRSALAAEVELESGTRPSWASAIPAPAEVVEPQAEAPDAEVAPEAEASTQG